MPNTHLGPQEMVVVIKESPEAFPDILRYLLEAATLYLLPLSDL